MAIIPRYTSRALPPGAQSGLIESAQKRGKAGARLASALGGAIVEGVEYKERKDKREAAEEAYWTRTFKEISETNKGLGDSLKDNKPFGEIGETPLPNGSTVEFGGSTPASNTVAGTAAWTGSNLFTQTDLQRKNSQYLDRHSNETGLAKAEAAFSRLRALAVSAARTGGFPAKGMASRMLAEFDRMAGKLAESVKDDPELKARFDAMAESSRAPLELRVLQLENHRRAGEEREALAGSLDTLALTVVDDPAMAPGVAGRGLAQIESAMKVGILAPDEAATMQGDFADRVHMSAMRGQIVADPEQALARLKSGEFDDVFAPGARNMLAGEARTTARVRAAGASAAARARRRGLELDMADHLAALDETGKGDEALEARARAELPADEYAAFQASAATARERNATRAEYAFMTPQEIEADIAQRAEGGPANIDRRDGDQRAAAHAIRTAIRDEVLAARAADPAGWAMRDEDVAAAYQAAQENPDDPMLARRAQAMRLALQREMGTDRPRLLSDAERDEVAGQLAQAAPADRPAIIADLRARYGPQANLLAAELTGEVDANTALLIAHADMPHLPRLLANGMAKSAKDGPATLTLARPEDSGLLPALPIIDKGEQGGRRLDMANMKPGRYYRAADGGVLLYDGEALAPVTVEIAAPGPADPNAPTPPLPLGGGDNEAEFTNLPSALKEGDTAGTGTNSGETLEAAGPEGQAFTSDDIPDPRDRQEFENLSISLTSAKTKKADHEENLAFKEQQFKDGKISANDIAEARRFFRKEIATQDGLIEQNEKRMEEIRIKAGVDAAAHSPRETPRAEDAAGDREALDVKELEEFKQRARDADRLTNEEFDQFTRDVHDSRMLGDSEKSWLHWMARKSRLGEELSLIEAERGVAEAKRIRDRIAGANGPGADEALREWDEIVTRRIEQRDAVLERERTEQRAAYDMVWKEKKAKTEARIQILRERAETMEQLAEQSGDRLPGLTRKSKKDAEEFRIAADKLERQLADESSKLDERFASIQQNREDTAKHRSENSRLDDAGYGVVTGGRKLKSGVQAIGVLGMIGEIEAERQMLQEAQEDLHGLRRSDRHTNVPAEQFAMVEHRVRVRGEVLDDIERMYKEGLASLSENLAEIREAAQNPAAISARKAWEEGNYGEFLDYLNVDPAGVILSILVEQLTVDLPSNLAGAVGGPVAGAAVSAYVGFGASIVHDLEEFGTDFNDTESIRLILEQHAEEIVENAKDSALASGAGSLAGDYIGNATGDRIVGAVSPDASVLAKGVTGTARIAVEETVSLPVGAVVENTVDTVLSGRSARAEPVGRRSARKARRKSN